jgi:hypothetical protein
MQTFVLSDFVNRTGKIPWSNTKLKVVLATLPAFNKEVWLAGGAVRRTLINQKLESDIDLFFKSKEAFDNYLQQLKDKFEVAKEVKNDHNVQLVVRFTDKEEWTIQLITVAYYDSLEKVLDSFDFTICQFGTDGENLVCGDHALWDLARMRLAVHHLVFPAASIRRMIKYTNQGFYACQGCIQTIVNFIADNSELSKNNISKYID